LNRVVRSIAALGATAWLAACASPRAPALDAGHFTGSVYENRSLGFQVVLPTGWVFLAPEQLERATREVFEKQPDPSGLAKASLARTTMLFGLVDLTHPPLPGEVPRSLTATLESLDGVMVGVTSETYAAAARMNIETSQAIASQFGKWHHQTIAGLEFVALPSIVEANGKRAHQDYFIRVEDGRALGLIVIYPENDETPQHALDAFQPLAPTGREPGANP
jgi:hypothetical protein